MTGERRRVDDGVHLQILQKMGDMQGTLGSIEATQKAIIENLDRGSKRMDGHGARLGKIEKWPVKIMGGALLAGGGGGTAIATLLKKYGIMP